MVFIYLYILLEAMAGRPTLEKAYTFSIFVINAVLAFHCNMKYVNKNVTISIHERLKRPNSARMMSQFLLIDHNAVTFYVSFYNVAKHISVYRVSQGVMTTPFACKCILWDFSPAAQFRRQISVLGRYVAV